MCLLVYPKTQNQINVLTTLFKEMNIDFEYTPPQEESYIPNDLTLQAMKEADEERATNGSKENIRKELSFPDGTKMIVLI